ncbi:MAG: EAL domain-containing protein [Armatimonadetes bacterium]|nr:EAL domain-containing protein [Armatimonadota bacterium]
MRQIDTPLANLALMHAMQEVARSLSMDITAEGVETSAQLALLRDIGFDYAQGFHIARPLEPEMATTIVQGGTRDAH